ncbi:MAG TPA: nickel-binding protein [Sphingomicrobium sp.]|nr:nickel-binding protein [Sphingomicrobium sp.]
MPEYVIEKSMPGLGKLSPVQRDQSVRRGCSTLHGVIPEVAWVRSYLTEDKCYCVFRAPSEQLLWDLIEKWDLDAPISICEIKQIAQPDSKS